MSGTGFPPREIRGLLLEWYDAHRRDLPWRDGSPDPYRVWVSEIMLQQTRVETVAPYFERWMERFPTVEALAGAPVDDVMKAWEGLGYYSRARNLHRAVREVAERYGGEIPGDDRFRQLPGVGRYTAGAVRSIAFGQAEPVVDGNVRRVFARLADDETPSDAFLWSSAETLVRGERPGDLNQAIMDLGATVCRLRGPDCPRCPVREHCEARRAGTQELRPAPRRRGEPARERWGVAIVQRDGRMLLLRRPDEGRLGGTWEFPSTRCEPGETTAAAAERGVLERAGMRLRAGPAPAGAVEHTFSHARARYEAYLCTVADRLEDGSAGGSGFRNHLRWVEYGELEQYALSRVQQRVASTVLQRAGRSPGVP